MQKWNAGISPGIPGGENPRQKGGDRALSSKPFLLNREQFKSFMYRLRTGFGIKSRNGAEEGPLKVGDQFKAAINFGKWINLLLFAVLAGFDLSYVCSDPVAVFTVNFVAILPIAVLLSFATEELINQVGSWSGIMIFTTFGYVGDSWNIRLREILTQISCLTVTWSH